MLCTSVMQWNRGLPPLLCFSSPIMLSVFMFTDAWMGTPLEFPRQISSWDIGFTRASVRIRHWASMSSLCRMTGLFLYMWPEVTEDGIVSPLKLGPPDWFIPNVYIPSSSWINRLRSNRQRIQFLSWPLIFEQRFWSHISRIRVAEGVVVVTLEAIEIVCIYICM